MKVLLETAPGLMPWKRRQQPEPEASGSPVSSIPSSTLSTTSTCSTCSTEQALDDDDWFGDSDDTDSQALHAGRRHVRFAAPSTYMVHENNVVRTRDEVQALWYTREDFVSWKRQTLQHARQLVQQQQQQQQADEDDNSEQGSSSSSSSSTTTTTLLVALNAAYTGFVHVQQPDDIHAVLDTLLLRTLPLYAADYVGMDRYINEAVVRDRASRKRRLQNQIQWWQRRYDNNSRRRSRTITTTTTSSSSSSRSASGADTDNDECTSKLRQVSRAESQPCRLYAHHLAQWAWMTSTMNDCDTS